MPAMDVDIENIKWIGWEPNNQGKYLPKNAQLNASMDPTKYNFIFPSRDERFFIIIFFTQQIVFGGTAIQFEIDEMASSARIGFE